MGENQGSEENVKPSGSEEALKQCTRLDADLAALKVAYEHYFLGMERKPPKLLHDALKSKINNLKVAFVHGASARFRIEGLHNKFLAYERMWARTLNEIENGTYRRDLFKARLRTKQRQESPPKEVNTNPSAGLRERELSGRGASESTIKQAGSRDGNKAEARPPSSSGSSAGGGSRAPENAGTLSDAKVKAIYDAYVTAKQKCNEDVSKISLAGLSQTLRKQVPDLLKQHKAKSVDFKIVIKDGKAVLKAVPK
jgi:hypothetical protein